MRITLPDGTLTEVRDDTTFKQLRDQLGIHYDTLMTLNGWVFNRDNESMQLYPGDTIEYYVTPMTLERAWELIEEAVDQCESEFGGRFTDAFNCVKGRHDHLSAYYDAMAFKIGDMKNLHENTDLALTKQKKEWAK
jgi:hypothetical protein